MKICFLVIFTTIMFLDITNMSAQSGYIIKIDGDKVYMNLPNAKVSDVVPVYNNGGSMTDPKTGRTIQTEPEVVGQIKIIAVQGAYSVGKIYGNLIAELQPEMVVGKRNVIQKNGYGETTVMIAPADLNFPQGMNTMVGDGYIGDYVSDALMEQLLKCDKIQLIDRSIYAIQQNEISMGQSGAIDPNTALEYGKISGAHYLIKITLQKPDVVTITNDVPVRGLVTAASNIGSGGRSSSNTNMSQYLPDNVHTANVKVSVKIVTKILDVQTGHLLFTSNGEGSANGKPQIGIESLQYGGNGIKLNNPDVPFTQTITSKAIDRAFKKIGKELIGYFNENL